MTDIGLMRALRRDNPEAMQVLVERYSRPLYAFLLGWTGNREDAMDLTQEVLLRVRSKAGLYNGLAPLRPWIFRIARNLFYDQARKKNFRVHSASETLDLKANPLRAPSRTSPEASFLRREALQRLEHGIRSLPNRQREVVQLRILGEMKLEEIAQALGLSLGGVKSTLHNGLCRLRKDLADLRSGING